MKNKLVKRYRILDVFTTQPLEGNALAVFPDASGIDDLTMQKIAKEMNLSETVFVLPKTSNDCDVRLRIFTPNKEMAFAGHPTIGAAFVLLDEGIIPQKTERFVLEEKVGPVSIRVDDGVPKLIWLQTPSITWGKTFDRDVCASALGLGSNDLLDISPQLLSAGNPTVFIAVKDKTAVDKAALDLQGNDVLKKDISEPFCIFVFAPTPEGAYSRMFAPDYGVPEDPATGSSTGPLAAYMMKHGLAPNAKGSRFISEQGTKMGRRSILHVYLSEENGRQIIEVGSNVTPVAEGTMEI